MATVKDIEAFLNKLDSDFVRRAVPRIVAEKATTFYKERFVVKKDPEGKPWPNTKNPVKKGSLMVRSGALQATPKPSVVRPDLVRISAGSSKVNYAKIQNEGGTIEVPITPKMRKFAWAMNYKTKDDKWKGMALTRKKTLTINIPSRRFMGKSTQLNAILLDSFKKAFKGLF